MESLARPVYTTARAANSKPQAGPVRAGAGESTTYAMWIQEKQFMLVPASAYVAKAVASFKEFPPRGLPANYSLSEALKSMESGSGAQQ